VKGATLSNATSTIKSKGFTDVTSTTGCVGGAPSTVVVQTPSAGEKAAFNTPVRLQVEANNCAVVVDVVGQQLDAAAKKLKAAGFGNIPYRYECLGSSNIGAVVTQSPAGGMDTTTDTPINLRLQANDCSP
jgi:beta-lactam-binding protein with PASTA domain